MLLFVIIFLIVKFRLRGVRSITFAEPDLKTNDSPPFCAKNESWQQRDWGPERIKQNVTSRTSGSAAIGCVYITLIIFFGCDFA